jgi:hypothetical protein
MSQERIEMRFAQTIELQHLDRILAVLSRPALDDADLALSVRGELLKLGICVAGEPGRRAPIQRLWDRKRRVLQRMSAVDVSWGNYPPGA